MHLERKVNKASLVLRDLLEALDQVVLVERPGIQALLVWPASLGQEVTPEPQEQLVVPALEVFFD